MVQPGSARDSQPPQLHLAPLDGSDALEERYRLLLSEDERQRASRFYRAIDRKHFVVARGTLRRLLAGRLKCDAGAIRFAYGEHGKPALAGDSSQLSFNVSHSHGWALYGISDGAPIGVDIEKIRPGICETTIPEQFFSEQECATLRSLPLEVQAEAFFNCWTRKEAFVKANGMGLSYDLGDFDVSLDPRDPAALLAIRGDPLEAARWTMHSFVPMAGFVAAVAVRDQREPIQIQTYAD